MAEAINIDEHLDMAEGIDLDPFGPFPIYNDILQVTQEDLEKVLTTEELTKLCLKRKCRVLIWRWNPVEDWRNAFKENGRWYRWNDRVKHNMLAKIVNKKKDTCLYKSEEIRKARKTEWALRKKDCLLDLNYWKHKEEREKKEQQTAISADEADPARDSESLVHDVDESVGAQPEYEDSLINAISLELSDNDSENSMISDISLELSDNDSENSQIMNMSEDVLVGNQTNSIKATKADENDISKDLSKGVIETHPIKDFSTQSPQNSIMLQKFLSSSQEPVPPDYEDFNTVMPSTSTQTQNVEHDYAQKK